MEDFETDRERAANDLAERLFFKLEKQGDRYSLYRKIGDHARRDNLTLDEVEHTLQIPQSTAGAADATLVDRKRLGFKFERHNRRSNVDQISSGREAWLSDGRARFSRVRCQAGEVASDSVPRWRTWLSERFEATRVLDLSIFSILGERQ